MTVGELLKALSSIDPHTQVVLLEDGCQGSPRQPAIARYGSSDSFGLDILISADREGLDMPDNIFLIASYDPEDPV